jgi:hypothetical protein
MSNRTTPAQIFLIGLLVLLCADRPAVVSAGDQPDVWYVAKYGSDTWGNGTVRAPFATIQHGIDSANHGDTVLVLPGVYTENINYLGKNITVTSLFHITGDEHYISQTIVDGGRLDSVVIFDSDEKPDAVLSGLTITNGRAQGTWPRHNGGGVRILNAAPYLHHLHIINNLAENEGGGVYLAQNQSDEKTARLSNCIISGNSARASGGGVRFSSDSKRVAVVERSIISGNTANRGAGAHIYHAGALENCLIVNNASDTSAGGVYVDWGSNYKGEPGAFIVNCTISNNQAPQYGGLDYIINGAIVKNSIIWGNSNGNWHGGSYTHSCTVPVPSGEGNIGDDPRFVDPLGDYHLSDDSPAIGAGTQESAPADDLAGNARPCPHGTFPDMGAYEHCPTYKVTAPIVMREWARDSR